MEDNSFPMAETFKSEFDCQINKLKKFTKHGPSLGRFVEILTLNLLHKYFPEKYKFSSGFYCSQNPSINSISSMQMDIICYDRFNYPILFDDNETVVVSPRSVKGLIEVKSTLTKSSIDQILSQSNADISKQLSNEVKFNLLAIKSTMSPKSVCKYIVEYYSGKDIVKALGIIYCLDWRDIIIFDTRNNEYKMYLLNNFNYGISSFINNLIVQIYGVDTYLSTANSIGTSLYIPKEIYKIR